MPVFEFLDDLEAFLLTDGDALADFRQTPGLLPGADQRQHGVPENLAVPRHGVAHFFPLGHLKGDIGDDAFENGGFDPVGLQFEGFDGRYVPFQSG